MRGTEILLLVAIYPFIPCKTLAIIASEPTLTVPVFARILFAVVFLFLAVFAVITIPTQALVSVIFIHAATMNTGQAVTEVCHRAIDSEVTCIAEATVRVMV